MALPRAYLKSHQPSGPWPTGVSPDQAADAARNGYAGFLRDLRYRSASMATLVSLGTNAAYLFSVAVTLGLVPPPPVGRGTAWMQRWSATSACGRAASWRPSSAGRPAWAGSRRSYFTARPAFTMAWTCR